MLQYLWNIQYSLSVHLFSERFYLFNTFMPDGNKKSCTLTQSSSWKMQVCFSTTHNERANKIHVHGYPFYIARNY